MLVAVAPQLPVALVDVLVPWLLVFPVAAAEGHIAVAARLKPPENAALDGQQSPDLVGDVPPEHAPSETVLPPLGWAEMRPVAGPRVAAVLRLARRDAGCHPAGLVHSGAPGLPGAGGILGPRQYTMRPAAGAASGLPAAASPGRECLPVP